MDKITSLACRQKVSCSYQNYALGVLDTSLGDNIGTCEASVSPQAKNMIKRWDAHSQFGDATYLN